MTNKRHFSDRKVKQNERKMKEYKRTSENISANM